MNNIVAALRDKVEGVLQAMLDDKAIFESDADENRLGVDWVQNYCLQYCFDLERYCDFYNWFYQTLSDDYSKEVFIELSMKRWFYILKIKYDSFKLIPTKAAYESAMNHLVICDPYDYGEVSPGRKNHLISCGGHKIITSRSNAVNTWVFKQYNYRNIVCVKDGDIILDCGAGQGEEAAYFFQNAKDISVHSFAVGKSERDLYFRNMQEIGFKNFALNSFAVWDIGGQVIKTMDSGSISKVDKTATQDVTTVSIDDYVKKNDIKRVDLIKADIEGAELQMLKGAIKTIHDFKPKLAIAAYHKPCDLRLVAQFIFDLNPDYDCYLKHCKNNISETMLYFI